MTVRAWAARSAVRHRRAARLPAAVAAALAWLGVLSLAGSQTALAQNAEPGSDHGATRAASPTLRIANHHDVGYTGPLIFATRLPDGTYAGDGGRGVVQSGTATVVASVPARDSVVLARTGPTSNLNATGPFDVATGDTALELEWKGRRVGAMALGLVVLPGERASLDDAVRAFSGASVQWRRAPDGTLHGTLAASGYTASIEATPYAGGWLDVQARVWSSAPYSTPKRAYVGLVRRLTIPGMARARERFNGRVLDSATSPDTWSRDFWYPHGVDWVSWRAGDVAMAAVNGFTPGPTHLRDSVWQEGSHFYVWEESRRARDTLYLISEMEGPNPHQATPRSKAVTAYAPITPGDTVHLRWRLALASHPAAGWEKSQLYVYAGYRDTTRTADGERLDLGVPAVAFGSSYLPYSTLGENLDFYRTPGENQETYWPFSPVMWRQWRAFQPRMQTDLHILRAMGFQWVRLHHLEMLQQMDRPEALAFLDWFTAQARALGLHVLFDSEGPTDWLATLAHRYGDVATRFELENEILIPGIPPAAPARWTAEYHTVKAASPGAQVFLTGSGNNGIFQRLRILGVPFDRVGLHFYKHGPGWEEAARSVALASADYARRLGTAVTLGEFNWKNLTRFSPEARRSEMARIYQSLLAPRAIPEVFQFQFQETMAVNPRLGRTGIRHYETLMLDRRPKPEALELMRLIRQYAAPEWAVGQLDISAPETTLRGGSAVASFTMHNRTAHPLTVSLQPESYDGLVVRLATPARVTVPAGGTVRGQAALSLPADAATGTYHWFLRADFDTLTRWGWGVAANPGAPTFDAKPVLTGRAAYPQGADVVQRLRWRGPLTVAWGPHAPVLELEIAYLVANSLESATGRPVAYMSTADLPDSLRNKGMLILVGTPQSNPLVPAAAAVDTTAAKVGVVRVIDSSSATTLLLTGQSAQAVQAAATDFVLRYWKHAKDAAIRVTGMEPERRSATRPGSGR